MSGYLQVCNSIDETSKTIVETLKRLWPQAAGALYLMSSDDLSFYRTGTWGDAEHAEVIESQSCWAYRLARPFPEYDDQTQFDCNSGGCGISGEKICLPISAGGSTFGLLHLSNVSIPLDSRSESILPMLIERAGFAIYSMRLRETLEFKSTRDSLTELYNRRYLDESLELEVSRCQRNHSDLSVIMFDLDRFKRLNDTYGHEAGDDALRVFSSLLRAGLRAGDIACRYGGEEFFLILPGTGLSQAAEIAERIRSNLQDNPADKELPPFLADLTVSAGVASMPQHGASADALLDKVDQALYQAKKSGRNKIVMAKPEAGAQADSNGSGACPVAG